VNDALQIFDCHNMAKILLPAELSPANMAVGPAPAVLRRERRWVRSPLAENPTTFWSHHSVLRSTFPARRPQTEAGVRTNSS
jgi:hypothetical protein